ncbi:GNAT family N-acetyltransferase [Bacillus thuringiensis]|uniref:GNAT family N-acetyltransferase n=1 Tax=Bacillus thuringiensis TaxID=1428 RepID=UPI000BF72F4C|nr:GNAT family N-acetyltransferase [Bacillus thuringiensis]PFS01991.1 GNAT family N-acetyltransferase [Bacillus thuringiensis]PFS11176.1 GNAT family N-acetyltransferase [Bacillus thuringiensis]PGN49179.1 GNAT family N-acetyltransferase [Bacillus thuringiensis]PGO78370.1 GNAT family N-acetyltransferase [Bacillus thuringiensis]PGP35564.1 GNAT family N-acetyltransferase [Bacillus thuringiensis]
MIYKLEKKDYYKIKRLLQTPDQKNDLTLNSIINGMNRGIIYVDNPQEPKTALIDVTGISSIFIGDATNKKFIDYLPEFLDNQLKLDTYESCGGTWFITVLKDETWEQVLENVIADKEYEVDYELYYQFNPETFSSLKEKYKPVLDNYLIKKINTEVIKNDPDGILSEVLEEVWYSIEDFSTHGFGYCVTKDNKVVSACFSCCVHGNKHEISVETYDEKYMNKGLATLVCAAYLVHCKKNGLVPQWSTMETNLESKRLAEKLGFKFESKLKTLEFEWQ